jgi:hypothetical protein
LNATSGRGGRATVPLRYSLDEKRNQNVPWGDREFKIVIRHADEQHYGKELHVIARPSPTDLTHAGVAEMEDEDRKLCELAVDSQNCTYTGSKSVLDYAKQLYERCRRNHPECGRLSERDWRPTRLLDISCESQIVLVDNTDVAGGDYATLSHCWGTSKFWVTTSANIKDLRSGVPATMFPKTFQDTVTTIRHLGIRYVWIDCYCIIQGVDEQAQRDWEREASQMHKVYANSVLNIGAAHASGSEEGLFSDRESLNSGKVRWAPESDASTESEWYLYTSNDSNGLHYRHRDSLQYLRSNSPLLKRAWVIQECVLSPRMLLFSRTQLYWQCSAAACCELFPRGEGLRFPSHATTFDFAFWTTKHIRYFDFNDESSRITPATTVHDFQFRWFYTLRMYTEAELTYPFKDKFKALEGVGKHVAQLTSDTYHRGLLANILPATLLWTSDEIFKRKTGSFPTPSTIVPSWHWAYNMSGIMMHVSDVLLTWKPSAYIFMSTDGRVFPSCKTDDTWPYLFAIGRLEPVSDLIRPWVKHWLQYASLPSDESRNIHPYEYVNVFLDPEQEIHNDYVFFPVLTGPERPGVYCERPRTGLILRKDTLETAWKRAGIFTASGPARAGFSKPQLVVLG